MYLATAASENQYAIRRPISCFVYQRADGDIRSLLGVIMDMLLTEV